MQGIIWGEPDLAQHCDFVEVILIVEFDLKLCMNRSTKSIKLFKVHCTAAWEVCASPCHIFV